MSDKQDADSFELDELRWQRRAVQEEKKLARKTWIRDAPHSGFAMLISWISWRMSVGTVGRPPRRLDFQRQYALKPARCQRMIVSGLTIANASQALGNSR